MRRSSVKRSKAIQMPYTFLKNTLIPILPRDKPCPQIAAFHAYKDGDELLLCQWFYDAFLCNPRYKWLAEVLSTGHDSGTVHCKRYAKPCKSTGSDHKNEDLTWLSPPQNRILNDNPGALKRKFQQSKSKPPAKLVVCTTPSRRICWSRLKTL